MSSSFVSFLITRDSMASFAFEITLFKSSFADTSANTPIVVANKEEISIHADSINDIILLLIELIKKLLY